MSEAITGKGWLNHFLKNLSWGGWRNADFPSMFPYGCWQCVGETLEMWVEPWMPVLLAVYPSLLPMLPFRHVACGRPSCEARKHVVGGAVQRYRQEMWHFSEMGWWLSEYLGTPATFGVVSGGLGLLMTASSTKIDPRRVQCLLV